MNATLSLALALVLVGASAARADALGDLRASLAKLTAREAVRASITIETHAKESGNDRPEAGKATFVAEHGPEGLHLAYAPDLIARAQQESRANEVNPETPTPTLVGIRRLDPADLMETLDGAKAMSRRLESATLVKDQRVNLGGRAARQLTISIKPKLSKSDAKRVKSLDVTMIVNLDEEGVPLSAERREKLKARFLLMSFEQDDRQSWTFARVGDRLVAVRHQRQESGSGMGQKFESSSVMTLVVRNGGA